MKQNYNGITSDEKLKKAILEEKARGVPDVEIGKKFGVSYKFIEKIITKEKGVNISNLNKKRSIKYLNPPNFQLEKTSVWSFKQRGNWATHSGEYRGNYSPFIPRNIILRYSKPGDLVLDIFCGAGTTAIEAKLLGRRCIASDINEKAIELAKENLDFQINPSLFSDDLKEQYFEPELYVHDARDLSWLKDETIDLICTHPPYANIIQYTDKKAEDLSFLDVEEFIIEMKKVSAECFRVLKKGKQLALLIGDIRRKKHVVPLGFMVINVFLEAGFFLRELIIKRQHNCKTTGFWYEKSIKNNFLLLAHEYLPVFEKPSNLEIPRRKTKRDKLFVKKELPLVSEKKFTSLETTTVWVYPEGQKDEYLAYNLVQRYSNGGNYIKLTIYPFNKDCKTRQLDFISSEIDKYTLIWIDALKIESELMFKTESYLEVVRKFVEQAINMLAPKGFIAIEAKDIRSNRMIIPCAKIIVDYLKDDRIWLKEIIIVSEENDINLIKNKNCSYKINKDELQIIHNYILVYEKKY